MFGTILSIWAWDVSFISLTATSPRTSWWVAESPLKFAD